jgi:hypothetical protein
MQTALLCGEQKGLEITYDGWVKSLSVSGLLGNWKINDDFTHDLMELFISLCNLLVQEGVSEFLLPKNLQYAIQLAMDELPGVPAKDLQIVKNLPKEVRREIRRHTRFSGGVQVRWLSRELNYEKKRTEDIIRALGYINVVSDWFIPSNVKIQDELTRFDVLEHAVRKMSQFCGPLSVENICSGMRHAAYRTRYPVPPPAVMKEILLNHGYATEENLFYWNGIINEELSRGEEIILECIKKNGPVIHHAEIVQAFMESELSFPSIHASLNRTPIIEKINTGLYKLRGMAVSINDIERANSAGERVRVDLVVSYDKTGKIKLVVSLGVFAIGTGVLFSESLPNLVGEWKCLVNENKFDNIVITENEIRRLTKPITYLKCEVGDRVSFSFDTWTRTVSLDKADNETN